MSLTAAIDDTRGPVGTFFRDRFPNRRAAQAAFRESIAGHPTIRPEPVAGRVPPLGVLGATFDYRARCYFPDFAPVPYGVGSTLPGRQLRPHTEEVRLGGLPSLPDCAPRYVGSIFARGSERRACPLRPRPDGGNR